MIQQMVSTLSTHARNPTIAQSAASTLAALAQNDANADAIAAVGGIAALISAITNNPDNVALLKVLLVLMERISRNDTYKVQIVQAGGLSVLIDVAIARHVNNDEVILKTLSTIANLAFNSGPNIAAIIKAGGVPAVERVLKTWAKQPRILENAMCALSNLMYGSDENKLVIGQTCGADVVKTVTDHVADVALFKMTLRALGNLSFCDDNIRFVVEKQGATRAIVAGMRANQKDEEALQLAMEVIGNFASLEEPAPEVDAEGNVKNPRDSIPMIVLKEAGCAEIIATLKKFPNNPSLLKAAMDALSNIANDVEVTELMARKQNLVPIVLDVIASHSWDADLVTHAIPLVATLTYSKDCINLVAQLDGIQVLLSAMEQHAGNADLLSSAQLALTNLAASEQARTAVRNMEGVRTMLALLESNMGVKTYVEEVMKTLTRLCADDRLSAQIAEQGMHIIITAVDRYVRDPEFLTSAFRLLGHLAFVESNLTIIVQHNGITKIINAITMHPDSQPLMVRSIQTLDNIAMANKENAAIVIDEGGKVLIETILDTYAGDEEISRYGKSALLSMSALENLSKSADITAKAAKAAKAATASGAKRAVDAGPKDPLAEYRHSLSAGKVMKVWTKGAPKAMHVVVSPDWKSIVWQDVGTQKKQGAMDLRGVVAIRAGTGDGHKKSMFTSKAVEPECAFTVVGDRGQSLDLEANNAKERANWVEALNKLVRAPPGGAGASATHTCSRACTWHASPRPAPFPAPQLHVFKTSPGSL